MMLDLKEKGNLKKIQVFLSEVIFLKILMKRVDHFLQGSNSRMFCTVVM